MFKKIWYNDSHIDEIIGRGELLCTIYGIRGTAAKNAVKDARIVICTILIPFGTRTVLRFTEQKRVSDIRFPKTGAVSTR
jgi:hypothetical protein